MAITALSSLIASQSTDSSTNLTSLQTALQSLQRSLGVGNLTAAQTAFAQLQKANANLNTFGGSTGSQTTTDLATLGAALAKGDLKAAGTALPTVQKDLIGVNASAITAAQDLATQALQQIDAILNISDAGQAASTATGTPDIASLTTSYLSAVYGDHSSSASTAVPSKNSLSVSA